MEWITPVGAARELAMARVSEAVERIMLIGQTPGSQHDRYSTASFAILRFAEQARAWHERFGSSDIEAHVRGELVELERAVMSRLGTSADPPEGTVAQLLQLLVASFPQRAGRAT